MSELAFQKYPSTPRLFRDMVITEKIDGTNVAIGITEDGEIRAGRRTSWLEKGDDHFGFYEWVMDNKDTLIEDLGPGIHRGEWYGYKIQRGYDLKERWLALFHSGRWADAEFKTPQLECVPVLYRGPFNTTIVDIEVATLKKFGSQASIGFMRPEGVIVFHDASGQVFKVTCENDEVPKSKVKK